MTDDSDKMVRAVYSMPKSLKAKVFDYFHEQKLKSEAEALRQLVEIGLKHAPKPKRK